jgi:hypothetical protein
MLGREVKEEKAPDPFSLSIENQNAPFSTQTTYLANIGPVPFSVPKLLGTIPFSAQRKEPPGAPGGSV